LWFANTYRSANDVIQMDDAENKVIVGKGYSNIFFNPGQAELWYTVKIEAKDGRYRYTVNDIIYDATNQYATYREPLNAVLFKSNGQPRQTNKIYKIKFKCIEQLNELIDSIQTGMESIVEDSDTW